MPPFAVWRTGALLSSQACKTAAHGFMQGEDISLHRLFSHVAQVFPAALPEVVDALLEMYSEVWEAETAAVDQLDALRMLRDEVQVSTC